MPSVPGFDEDIRRVSAHAFDPEPKAVEALLPLARSSHAPAVHKRALRYVKAVRAHGAKSGIEKFQHEYGLSSREGIMIMCLAEALLRIPDSATADALIHDKLAGGEWWDRHVGMGRPLLTRAGALGLEIAGAISDENNLKSSAGEFVGGLIHRLGEPMVRGALKAAMKTMGSAFVVGNNLKAAQKKRGGGALFSFDMLGEGARSAAQAEGYFTRYMDAVKSLKGQKGALHSRDGISIKLSALHARFELRSWDVLEAELLPKLRALAAESSKAGIPLQIDAEEATRLDVTLMVYQALLKSPECGDGVGLVVQAYQKRAPYVIDWLAELARARGKRIPVRLVKGAYWDGEIKRAQEAGLEGYPVYTRKEHTDISYLACAKKLLSAPELFYPQFATHNAHTIASILVMAGSAEYEFQRLWGMGEALYREVAKDAPRPVRVYAPVGEPKYLLSYLIRRILENGANSSFVRGLWEEPLETLLADPVEQAVHFASLPPLAGGVGGGNAVPQSLAGTPLTPPASGRGIGASHAAMLPLPDDIIAGRANSRGYDLGNMAQLEVLLQAPPSIPAAPVKTHSAADADTAFAAAAKAFPAWHEAGVEKRAQLLERTGELFAKHERELLALLADEGRKVLSDGIAEVREAIDYCRYYAQSARRVLQEQPMAQVSGERNSLGLEPRGTFVAISPWNFPLAIFTGQAAAALVTGNCVIAKPAEQTPRIAAFAIKLMHEAGIPKGALHLLQGSGEEIGQALVNDVRCAGVAFTGSTETAWAINRALASRKGPIAALIAETGGQNCMVIDSSALIEQAVDDLAVSAFGSAGQRCSAARVAFVQEDIAAEFLEVLAGAMRQLRPGAPENIATDIPPVIDAQAYEALMDHIAKMKKSAQLIAASSLPPGAEKQLLVAPHAFEIPSIDALSGEVFGPVLHIIRWREGELDKVIAQINSTGFGLTFGVHSRIDARIRELSLKVRAGNIYVNRSMIGAGVGMQPFGGHGLSGTGPKAGGPHYLSRFCCERTICVNTAAVGGNLELLT